MLFIHMLNNSLCHPPRQGQPSPESYAPSSPSPSASSIYNLFITISFQFVAVHGVAQLYDGLPPCPELQLTQSLSLFNLYIDPYIEKIIGGQMIQISGGKSALWWEQKRQMSGGKCDKLGGGKSDKGKWTPLCIFSFFKLLCVFKCVLKALV